MTKRTIETVGRMKICSCDKRRCVVTNAFPDARFSLPIVNGVSPSWHEVIRNGEVTYKDLGELVERKE